MHRVFYVSDGTAITAEVFGHAVLSQFPTQFDSITIPFVDTLERARLVREQIDQSISHDLEQILVFHTIVSPEVRAEICCCKATCYDFLNSFVAPIEEQLNLKAKPQLHRTHGMDNRAHYDQRIDAVNYALDNDDGVSTKAYDKAQIILLGVSRCGKTPTSLYMALQFGLRAANYPFIAQDMDRLELPQTLKQNRHKLFGLTIAPQRLHEIRSQRRANSQYASMEQCQLEVERVEQLFRLEAIPFINTSNHSVEEISATVIDRSGLKRSHG